MNVADFYSPGIVKLFYRTAGGRTDVNPTACVTRPDFSILSGPEPRDIGDGTYCFEFCFSVEGSYLVRFYENEVMTTLQHLEIRRNKWPSGNKLINL